MHNFPHQSLRDWFLQAQREFPWRGSPSPYQVWISEVMLQQTQAAVVIPYFERWMERFPDIPTLARASLEEVVKAWEGLGYYSRARHLHRAAQTILLDHEGELPKKREELEKIPGLGPYTIGAILSFAFHQKAAAVDANVARVLARYFSIEEELSKTNVQKKIQQRTQALLPDHEPWVVMEALIELGAQVCRKDPQCHRCPLQRQCVAFQEGKTTLLPLKKTKINYVGLVRSVAIVQAEGAILVKKGESGKVMADLYEFPYFESSHLDPEIIENTLGLEALYARTLSPVTHTFTRFRVRLLPSVWNCRGKKEIPGYAWISLSMAHELPFSSGHRRILHQLK